MLVVQGITTDGKRFRPSTWTDMLVGRYTCSVTGSVWGNVTKAEALRCRTISTHISVCCCNASGNCEIRVSEDLKYTEPAIYNHIKQFAITNRLQYTEGGDSNE